MRSPAWRGHQAPSSAAGSPAARRWLAVSDAALAAVLFVLPWAVGGRHPVWGVLFAVLVGVQAAGWAAARVCGAGPPRLAGHGGEWIFAAALLLIAAQLAAWPEAWLAALSPATGELLPLWGEGAREAAGLPAWRVASFTPAETRTGLALCGAYALFFTVCYQRMQSLADVQRVLRWVGLAAAVLAAGGLVQFFAGAARFGGWYEHPFRLASNALSGPFVNRNHFVHLLALGTGPLLWQAWHLLRGETGRRGAGRTAHVRSAPAAAGWEWALWGGALAVTLFAAGAAASRGGALATVLAAAVVTGAWLWQGLVSRRIAAAAAGAGVLVAAGLAIYGYEPLARRLGTLGAAESLEVASAGRLGLWQALAPALPRFAVLGSGIGSHAEVYPIYYAEPQSGEFSHAESGYLQVALEAGAPGAMLVLVALGTAGGWAWAGLRQGRSSAARAMAGAVLASLAVSAAHALVDFAWYLPACLAATLVLAACAARLRGLAAEAPSAARASGEPAVRSPAWPWLVAAPVVAGLAAWRMLPAVAAEGPWDRFCRGSQALASDDPAALAALAAELDAVLAARPDHARARVKRSTLALLQFEAEQARSENPLPLAQLREAAQASGFPGTAAQDEWLARAIGPRRALLDQAAVDARLGLELCPLQGEAYLHLAQVEFLRRPDAMPAPWVAQARRVRPHHGAVLAAAGSEAVLRGEWEEALALWRRACRQDPREQELLLAALAPQAPAAAVLEWLQPDAAGARQLAEQYRRLGSAADARVAERRAAELFAQRAAEAPPAEAARHWLAAHGHAVRAEEPAAALTFLSRAAEAAPERYDIRERWARALAAAERDAEAAEQLRWCLARRPNAPGLAELLVRCERRRLVAPETAAGAGSLRR